MISGTGSKRLTGARGVEDVGKQSRSDPMETVPPGKRRSDSPEVSSLESVYRHFPPPPPSRTLLCCKFTKSLATGTRPVRWTLATSNRHHQIRWSPFTDFSHSFHHSTLTYIFEVFSELTRGESDTDSCNGEPSPSDPMESVCRHIFHPVRNSILCCIFT